MAVSTKTIKRRIKSVKNTKKITKAMELVSAAKMRRAVEAVQNSRTYARLAWDLLLHLSEVRSTVQLPLLAVRPVKKVVLILMTSNRGLCGSFNSNIVKKTIQTIRENEAGADVSVIALGKKGGDTIAKQNFTVDAVYSDLSDTPNLADILPVIKAVIESFTNGICDKVLLAYTDFKSAINQIPTVRQVLPFLKEELESTLVQADLEPEEGTEMIIDEDGGAYLFEPGKKEMLEMILPRLIETQIYQAVLESSASEHSARMMAMRNASDAAEEMVDELNLSFNKARQAGITQQIAEIAGGAAALG